MKLIISDVNIPDPVDEDTIVFQQDTSVPRACTGCFGCWTKTPGLCVIPDEYAQTGALAGHADQVVIISECTYGGYSPFVKAVLDRSISYVHPDFVIRDGAMHHKDRYENSFALKVHMYGDHLSESEQKTAEGIVKANARNFNAQDAAVSFHGTPEAALKGAGLCR